MRVIVVGSGPSGVHFALGALARGHEVTMLDAGRSDNAYPLPGSDLAGLRRDLDDPVSWFNGRDYEGVVLPPEPGGPDAEFYGLPPSKEAVFAPHPLFALRRDGFAPLVSFGRGGLAEAWTAGAYAFDTADMADFPLAAEELMPWYGEVARRIGVGGAADDLAADFPLHDHLAAPVALDTASADLLARYQNRRANRAFQGVRFGRSRQAVLSGDRDGRQGCSRCGRCLWGCATGALYTPGISLAECRASPRFRYLDNRFVTHLVIGESGQIEAVETRGPAGDDRHCADRYVLAAGTLNSSAIMLRSHQRAFGRIAVLEGLMDNRQVLAPFVNLGMIGRPVAARAYQYHQLAVAIDGEAPEGRIHGQITTYTDGQVHPVLQGLPTDLATARVLFRQLRNALGVVNLNFADTRRAGNHLTLDPEGPGDLPRLVARYRPEPQETARIERSLARLRRAMRGLFAPLIPGMTHVRPMGASVHYAGTLPMTATARPFAVTPGCRSWDHPNLWVVDGSVLPALPAKNLTFTLMANAARVAGTGF